MEKKEKKCYLCCMVFKSHAGLVTHNRFIHGSLKEWKCRRCDKSFPTIVKLRSHTDCNNRRLSVLCPLCHHSSFSRKDLLQHFSQEHNIQIEKEKINFKSVDEFMKWKDKIEIDTTSKFICRRGMVQSKDGYTRVYACHRAGKYVPSSPGKRCLKTIGSNKINGDCPARILVKSNKLNGTVLVEFTKTHIGHKNELRRLTLSWEDKSWIASRIEAQVPFEKILGEIRDSVRFGELQRRHLVTAKDLHNIARLYGLDRPTSQAEEVESVDSWVRRMQSSDRLVRMYKPKGASHQLLAKQHLFLVLANDTQLAMLTKYGGGCVCVDVVRSGGQYECHLFTIIVLDETNNSFPCAFLFSSVEDSEAMELYFKIIKQCLPSPIEPKFFVSDVGDCYSAWCSVMPHDNTRPLYCRWLLDEAWTKNLSRIKDNDDLQAQVYKQLRILIQETDKEKFEDIKEKLLFELYSLEETVDFACYIQPFFDEPSHWASCFDNTSRIITSTALENMHHIIEHMYLKGKKEGRFYKGIQALMRFLKEFLFDRLTLQEGMVGHKLKDLKVRHRTAMKMSCEDVSSIDGGWIISTSKNPIEKYEVRENNKTCNCSIRCTECSACIHYYTCTCIDYLAKWNMCKHVHLIAHLEKSSEGELPSDSVTIDEQTETGYREQNLSVPVKKKTFEELKQEVSEQMNRLLGLIETEEELHSVRNSLAAAEDMVKNMKAQANKEKQIVLAHQLLTCTAEATSSHVIASGPKVVLVSPSTTGSPLSTGNVTTAIVVATNKIPNGNLGSTTQQITSSQSLRVAPTLVSRSSGNGTSAVSVFPPLVPISCSTERTGPAENVAMKRSPGAMEDPPPLVPMQKVSASDCPSTKIVKVVKVRRTSDQVLHLLVDPQQPYASIN